jgi:hypothetical protein
VRVDPLESRRHVDELDLPDDCWTTPIGDIELGDVCEAIPFAALQEDRISRLVTPEDESGVYLVPVLHSYGLVVGLVSDYAIVAAIGTSDGVGDNDLFSTLVDSGRRARTHIRLPRIPEDPTDAWSGQDGVVMLSQVETFGINYELIRRRVAAMSEPAREILRRRIASAVDR